MVGVLVLVSLASLLGCNSKEKDACAKAKQKASQAWVAVNSRVEEDDRASLALADAIVKANSPKPGDTDVARAVGYFKFAKELGAYQKTLSAVLASLKGATYSSGPLTDKAATNVVDAVTAHRAQAKKYLAHNREGVDFGGGNDVLNTQLAIARDVAESDTKGQLKEKLDAAVDAQNEAVKLCAAVK